MNAQATGEAVEYLRRSVERDKSADRDRGAGQRAANRDQAARDGVTITRTFDGDWGTSGGRGKRGKRTAMAELIEAIRAGEVSRVYCHTTDRLARDVEYGMTLWNACKDAGTILRPGSQTFDPREPGYLTLWTVLLAQAEEDLDRITRKNVDVQAFSRAHVATCELPGRPHRRPCREVGCGDSTHCRYAHDRGQAPYGERPGEDFGAVLAAYRETRSLQGTARLLNDRGIPSRHGRPWRESAVRAMLRRRAPEELPATAGARPAARTYALNGLLVCPHDGTILNGKTVHGSWIAYVCRRARELPDHPRPRSVSEPILLRWARDEAARLLVPDGLVIDTDADAERAAIEARIRRVGDRYELGELPEVEYRAKVAELRAEAARIERRQAAPIIPPAIRWDWPPRQLNAVLRALWDHVELGADLRPVRAEWRVPEWRREL